MICRFWWAQQENENKMHWLSWEVLTKQKREGGLGFRDLYGFNMAMLARQAWRMLTAPDSLCARVLKAKYFPNTSILKAQPVAGMSYTWRSILKGLELLKEGLVWRVGDGTDIHIWTDPWLPREDAPRPITPKGRCLLSRVSELIDPGTGQWDEQLVRNNFWEMDANTILAIPIRDDFEDFIAWRYDNKGAFSVKSAYKLYVNIRDGPRATSSNAAPHDQFWKAIWKLPVPPKVQQFIWRLAHNSLPLRMNIKQRGIECDTLCQCCKRLDEDGAHLFLKCKVVKQAWQRLGLEEVHERMCKKQTAFAMIEELLALKSDQLSVVACTFWRSWTRRNKINAQEKEWSLEELLSQINYWTTESKLYCQKTEAVAAARRQQRWSAPEGDWIKFNTDGAFYPETKHGGWGFVARDQQGRVRGTGAGRLNYVANAAQAEATACIHALQAAADWGVTKLILETDSTNLVRAMEPLEFDRAPEGVLYRDIRVFIRLHFNSVQLMYCPRGCNNVAHALAALGASGVESSRLWLDEAPESVMVFVASDSAMPLE
jgi:hypothetical protein